MVDISNAHFFGKGFTHTYGADYFENFSPIVRLNSINDIFSIIVNQRRLMFQLDVKSAFLYDDLMEKVEQSPGFIAQEKNMVCKLKKAIYGNK